MHVLVALGPAKLSWPNCAGQTLSLFHYGSLEKDLRRNPKLSGTQASSCAKTAFVPIPLAMLLWRQWVSSTLRLCLEERRAEETQVGLSSSERGLEIHATVPTHLAGPILSSLQHRHRSEGATQPKLGPHGLGNGPRIWPYG